MKEIFLEFISSGWFIYSMYLYLFLLIMYIIYSTMNYFKYHSRMQKTLQAIYVQMSEQERARADAERQQRDIHGEGIKTDWLARLDEELAYSGIKDKFRWMTTEIYIIIVIVTTTITTTVATVYKGLWQGILAFIITIIAFRVIITLMANARDKRTETQLLQFMNIIDNFSRTSDDLIDIFEKASRYIEDPLGSQIYDAVQSARNTGDSLLALQELQDSVKSKHFKILVRNLETSSRFENNYSDIIEDCRDIFHDYIKSQKEKRYLRVNGVLEIGIMVVTGLLSVSMIGQMTEEGDVIEALLSNGLPGIILFWVLIGAIIVSMYIAVFKILRDRK